MIYRIFLCLMWCASAQAAVPVFREPTSAVTSGAYPKGLLEKKTHEIRLEKWMQIEVNGQRGWLLASQVWLPADLVHTGVAATNSPLLRDIPARANHAGRAIAHLIPGERLSILARYGSWAQVRTPRGTMGFVKESELWHSPSPQHALVRATGCDMRSQPSFQAPRVRFLVPGVNLKILGSKTVRWGLAQVSSVGPVWWAIEDDARILDPGQRPKKTSELFRQPIFDMATSPQIPNLSFLSANGVYRSLDGENWERLELFAQQNYPLAISSNGHVFVGDTKSRDHGQTFEGYIQWDRLVEAVRDHDSIHLGDLRLVRIEFPEGSDHIVQLTLQSAGRELVVIGDLGLATQAAGYHWRFESSRMFW